MSDTNPALQSSQFIALLFELLLQERVLLLLRGKLRLLLRELLLLLFDLLLLLLDGVDQYDVELVVFDALDFTRVIVRDQQWFNGRHFFSDQTQIGLIAFFPIESDRAQARDQV